MKRAGEPVLEFPQGGPNPMSQDVCLTDWDSRLSAAEIPEVSEAASRR